MLQQFVDAVIEEVRDGRPLPIQRISNDKIRYNFLLKRPFNEGIVLNSLNCRLSHK